MGFFAVKGIYDDYNAGAYDRLICMGLDYAGDSNCTVHRNTVHKAVQVFFCMLMWNGMDFNAITLLWKWCG